MALRAGRRDAGRDSAIPDLVDETLEPLDLDHVAPRRRRRHRHPHGQRPARLRDGPAARASAARGSSSAAFTPRSFRTRPANVGEAHAVVKGDGDLIWATVLDDCVARRRRAPIYEARAHRRRAFVPARWDLLPAQALHVGVGADRARLPEALLVLFRVADRRPGAAAARRATPSSTKSSSCGGAGSASSRSPTTTSTRSRSTTSRRRPAARTKRGFTSSRRCARSASS